MSLKLFTKNSLIALFYIHKGWENSCITLISNFQKIVNAKFRGMYVQKVFFTKNINQNFPKNFVNNSPKSLC